MLTIRQEQLDALAELRWQDFYRRALAHVRAEFGASAEHLSDRDLYRLFQSTVDRAHAFGLRTEQQLICMIDATLMLGDRFEERPECDWAKKVLTSQKLVPDDRAKILLAMAVGIANRQQTRARQPVHA